MGGYEPRVAIHQAQRVTLWASARDVVIDALARGTAAVDACNRWHSGAYLLETVPLGLLLLERFGGDPEEAIVPAANDTWDNDSIAAIVGAAVGALHWKDALPRRWRGGLLGRTHASDDGVVFRIVDEARCTFQQFPETKDPTS